MDNQAVEKVVLFWEMFLKKTGRHEATKYLEVFHFELTEKLANELLHLVLIGQKKATASSLWSYELEEERIPEVGNLSIVTDWEGVPRCVIETTAITILPFSEITYEICKREGEDESLASWRGGIVVSLRQKARHLVMCLVRICQSFSRISRSFIRCEVKLRSPSIYWRIADRIID